LATVQPPRPHSKIVFPSTNFPFFPFQTANDTNDRQQTKINITLYTSSLQINSKIPIQTSSKTPRTPTARLNTGTYASLPEPTMQGMWLLQSIAANFFILGKLPPPPTQATMAIATCSLNRHHLSQKAQQAKTTTHRGGNCRSKRHLDKSPKSVNINAIIADINLPQTRFKTILTALGPAAEGGNETEQKTQDNDLDNLHTLEPPPEKADHVTPLASLTGIDHQPNKEDSATTNNDGKEESPQARVRISKAPVPADTNQMPAAPTTSRRLILQSALTGASQRSNSSMSNDEASHSKSHIKEVHDHTNMLFQVFSNNGMKETSYHVSDFAGLYPIWPIIEFSMAPTGAAKDKRMNLFTKCVTALLGEILYVNDTVQIATILITEDKLHYISLTADLPTNFTKLSQYIMISGGSWVFNKKEKDSNDVYARFRLKSQVNTEEIMNRVSFKFSHLGGRTCKRSSTKRWKQRCHSCCFLCATVWIR
jgi:hypothetical protein